MYCVYSYYFIITSTIFFGCQAIRLVKLDFPSMVKVGEDVFMTCDYDLEGSQMYSIKWYKDNVEFYRHIPKINQIKIFNATGVYVANDSNAKKIHLVNAEVSSSGEYKCEVSEDSPYFQTQISLRKLFVYILPKNDPEITGKRYDITLGQVIHMNCSSGFSRPAPNLTWYINDVKVPVEKTIVYPVEKKLNRDFDTTEKKVLGLKFRLEKDQIENGRVSVECVASIDVLRGIIDNSLITRVDNVHLRKLYSDRSLAWTTSDLDENGTKTTKMEHVIKLIVLSVMILSLAEKLSEFGTTSTIFS